jgi:hypothetical protein
VVRGCVVEGCEVPGVVVSGVPEVPGVAVPEFGVTVSGVGVTVSGVVLVVPDGLVVVSGLFDIGALLPGVAGEPGVVDPVAPGFAVPGTVAPVLFEEPGA